MRADATRIRDELLSFAGPLILVLLVGVWVLLLDVGAVMVIHPVLGTSVTATSGPTPNGFITAMYVAGDSMSTVGTSDWCRGPRSFGYFTRLSQFWGFQFSRLP